MLPFLTRHALLTKTVTTPVLPKDSMLVFLKRATIFAFLQSCHWH